MSQLTREQKNSMIGKYTIGTAISCSVSFKDQLPPEELAALLSGKKPLGEDWLFHISTLFNETPHDFLEGTMRELQLSISDLENIYLQLPPLLQGKHFKDFIHG